MKNNPFFSIVADSSDRLFVTDKSGKTVFFPWGAGKQGYYVKNKNVATKAKNFYKTSLLVCFVVLIIALSLFDKNFWGVVGATVVCFGGWYFVYFLYVSRIVKSLPPAKSSYKELVLAKLETEDVEEQPKTHFPVYWSKPIPPTANDPFSGIKRIWYRLSPSQLFMLYLFTGMIIILIWVSYHPQGFGNVPEDFLIAFIVCLLWGFSGFVMAKNMESAKADWFGFFQWKLPTILIAVVCWILAALSLYKFVVMMVI